MALRVVVADDHFLVRQGTAALLGEDERIEVVGLAQSLSQLLAVVEQERPGAVLTDIRMPPTFTDKGLQAARQIRRDHPGTGVVVLSQFAEPADVTELFGGGVAGLGFLLKERVSRADELGIRAALGRRRWLGARPDRGRGAGGAADRAGPLAVAHADRS